MEQTILALAGLDIAEGFAHIQHVMLDNVCEPCEEEERRLGEELIVAGLLRLERAELGQSIGIQLFQRGYDAELEDVPNWRLMQRLADYEADPRVRRKREEAAGIAPIRERRPKKKPAFVRTERRLVAAEV